MVDFVHANLLPAAGGVSWRHLACSRHFGGLSPACLPAELRAVALNWLCETWRASSSRPPLEAPLRPILLRPLECVLQRRAVLTGALLFVAKPLAAAGTISGWIVWHRTRGC